MAEYKIVKGYYDARNVEDFETLGIIQGDDVYAFAKHLLTCGYSGRIKKGRGSFTAVLDLDDHHGYHVETYYINKVRKPKVLTSADWEEGIKSFAECGFTRRDDGVYY